MICYNKQSYYNKFNLLTVLFAGMIICGGVLMPSIVIFEQLQTLFFVYLVFVLVIVGSFFLVLLAIKQDKLREKWK